MESISERLKWARKRDGRFKSPTEAATALGWTVSTYLGHENGDRNPSRAAAKKYAKAYKIRWEWLLESEGGPLSRAMEAPIRGRVGAGNEVHPLDDGDPGLGTVPLSLPPDAQAVQVDGDSMRPRYFHGERLLYLPTPQHPRDLLGRECVVKLTDGRMLVKIIRRGTKPQLYNLESWNADTMENQEIDWVSPVRWRV